MEQIFSKVLSMSVSASVVIIAVIFLRLLLKRASRKYAYILWLVVFFRLICPVKIKSPVGVVPVKENIIAYEQNVSAWKIADQDSENGILDQDEIGRLSEQELLREENVNGILKQEKIETIEDKPVTFRESMLVYLPVMWIMGVFALGVCGVVSFLRLKYRLRTAVLVKENIYESREIDTAFLLGFFKPCIYLPMGIDEEREYVIAHELMHKKRMDHLVKPVCYLAVLLHWFNPLVWLSFRLMVKDMEMACDEQVLQEAAEDIRGAYSKSLLNLSVKRSGFAMPLGFGESNTKERIRNVLGYKKSPVWIGAGAVVILLIAAVLLLPNASRGEKKQAFEKLSWEELGLAENMQQTEVFFQELCEKRNSYVGDNSADGRLISLLPELNCYGYEGMSLQTQEQPYGLTMVYEKIGPMNVEEEFQNTDTMIRNALFLFATIENMDVCEFVLVEDAKEFLNSEQNTVAKTETLDSDRNTGVDFEIDRRSYTRADMEELFGSLYVQSETPEGLRALNDVYVNYKEKMKKLASSDVEVMGLDMAESVWNDLKNNTLENTHLENDKAADSAMENNDGEDSDISGQIHTLISQAILNYMEVKNGEGQEYMEAHRILGGDDVIFQEVLQSDQVMELYVVVQGAISGNVTKLVWGSQEIADTKVSGEDNVHIGNGATTQLQPLGACFPAKVTISIAEDGKYELTDFWTPRDQDLLEEDVKATFPKEYWEMAITMEGYKDELAQELMQRGVIPLN